jgi:hypothetical protein
MRHYITVQGFEVTPEGERYVLWDGIEGTAVPGTVTMQYIGAVRAEAPGPPTVTLPPDYGVELAVARTRVIVR